MSNVKFDSSLIDKLGGNSKIMEMTGLTSQAISMWRKKGIPRAWKKVLETELDKQRNTHNRDKSHEQARQTEVEPD